MDRPTAYAPHDLFGDFVRLVRPRAVLSAAFIARAPWAHSFAPGHALEFGVVVSGRCVIVADGARPIVCVAGDVYVLTVPAGPSRGYRLASDADVDATPAPGGATADNVVADDDGLDGTAREDDVVETRIVGGHFEFDVDNAELLLAVLPPVVRVQGPDGSALRLLGTLLALELSTTTNLGHNVVLEGLARALLVHVLRAIDDVGSATGTGRRAARGWLRGLGDPPIAAALQVMHADIAARPDLVALAAAAGLSRSAFAARFKKVVGAAPLAWAIEWRMTLAKDALRTTTTSIGALGFSLGYESESAFSAAFKRVVGTSPRAFRSQA